MRPEEPCLRNEYADLCNVLFIAISKSIKLTCSSLCLSSLLIDFEGKRNKKRQKNKNCNNTRLFRIAGLSTAHVFRLSYLKFAGFKCMLKV